MPRKRFEIHRGSIVYRACARALSLPHGINNTYATRIIDHLVMVVVSVATSHGAIHSNLNLRNQQDNLVQFLLYTPWSTGEALYLVSFHLAHMLHQKKCRRAIENYYFHLSRQRDIPKQSFLKFDDNISGDDFNSLSPLPNVTTNLPSLCSNPPPSLPTTIHITTTASPPPCCQQNCLPPCNTNCILCKFFSYHHPCEHCEWAEGRSRRPTNTPEYNRQFIFHFCMDDKRKIDEEDVKIKQKFEGEDKSQSIFSYSNNSQSIVTLDVFGDESKQKQPNKTHKKPAFPEYVERFGVEHAEKWVAYNTFRKTLRAETPGTIRPLLPPEKDYFDFVKKYYEHLPTVRVSPHNFNKPPPSWIKRYSEFHPPVSYINLLASLAQFVKDCKACSASERNNWHDVLSPFPIGSLSRVLWSIAFLKSTNGVADKVSCGHFRTIIKKSHQLSIEIYNDPYAIASILRQTSKWVKNTFVIMNIYRHIHLIWNNVPSQNFSEWLEFYEIGPKTASLIFHAAFGKLTTLPVDSHVMHAFSKWGWTNAKSPDECSWQASQWMDPSLFLSTNDTIGSIRQTLADHRGRRQVILRSRTLSPKLRTLIEALQ